VTCCAANREVASLDQVSFEVNDVFDKIEKGNAEEDVTFAGVWVDTSPSSTRSGRGAAEFTFGDFDDLDINHILPIGRSHDSTVSRQGRGSSSALPSFGKGSGNALPSFGRGASNASLKSKGIELEMISMESNPLSPGVFGTPKLDNLKKDIEYEDTGKSSFEVTQDGDNKGVDKGDKKGKFNGMVKIIIAYLQVLSILPGAMPGIRWPSAFSFISSMLGLVRLEFTHFVPLGCIIPGGLSYYGIFFIMISMPVLLICGIMLTLSMRLATEFMNASAIMTKRVINQHINTALGVLYLVYPAVSIKILQIFNCRNIEGTYYMYLDLTQECFTSEWSMYAMIAGAAFLVYTVGIPIFCYVLIQRNIHKIHLPYFKERFGFLYQDFRTDVPFGENAEMVRKITSTSMILFMLPDSVMQVGIALVICFLFWIEHTKTQPYRYISLNLVQEFNLGGLTFTCFCAVMLKALDCTDGPNDPQYIANQANLEIMQIVLMVGNFFIVAIMIYIAIFDGLFAKDELVIDQVARWVSSFAMLFINDNRRVEVFESSKPCGLLTNSVDYDKLDEKLPLRPLLRSRLMILNPEVNANRESNEVINTLVDCYEQVLWMKLGYIDVEGEAAIQFQTYRKEDKVWPPHTYGGINEYMKIISVIRRELEVGRNSLRHVDDKSVRIFQDAFKRAEMSDPELRDALNVWHPFVNSVSKMEEFLRLLGQACGEIYPVEIEHDIHAICMEAKERASLSLNHELSVAIDYILRQKAESSASGKDVITQQPELHLAFNAIIDMMQKFGLPVPVEDEKAELLRSAEIWLNIDHEISFDGFKDWFLEYHGIMGEGDTRPKSPSPASPGSRPATFREPPMSRVKAALLSRREQLRVRSLTTPRGARGGPSENSHTEMVRKTGRMKDKARERLLAKKAAWKKKDAPVEPVEIKPTEDKLSPEVATFGTSALQPPIDVQKEKEREQKKKQEEEITRLKQERQQRMEQKKKVQVSSPQKEVTQPTENAVADDSPAPAGLSRLKATKSALAAKKVQRAAVEGDGSTGKPVDLKEKIRLRRAQRAGAAEIPQEDEAASAIPASPVLAQDIEATNQVTTPQAGSVVELPDEAVSEAPSKSKLNAAKQSWSSATDAAPPEKLSMKDRIAARRAARAAGGKKE